MLKTNRHEIKIPLFNSQGFCHSTEGSEGKPRADLKIADAFEVSLDYLVGEGVNSKFDKKTLKRLHDLEALEEEKHINNTREIGYASFWDLVLSGGKY